MDFFYDQRISIVQIKCGFAHNLALDAAGRACYFFYISCILATQFNFYFGEKNEKYIFDFNESYGNDVSDSNGDLYGEVDHPNWLITESYNWKLISVYICNREFISTATAIT